MPNVIGGIAQPRFLICGPELWPNRSFEVDLNGVTGNEVTRVFDTTTPFGDYILRVADTNAGVQEYAQFAIDTGAAIANRTFVVLAWVRDDDEQGLSFWSDFPGLTGTFTQEYSADEVWRQQVVHEITVPADAVGNTLNFRLYPFDKAAGNAGTGALRVDNFQCREVTDMFVLPDIDRENFDEAFRDEFQARNRLAGGQMKSYYLGARYFFNARYEVLDAVDEALRRILMRKNRDVFFFPRSDSSFGLFVEWDEDFENKWAFGMADYGHEGNLSLVGTELLPEPPDASGDGYIFMEEGFIF